MPNNTTMPDWAIDALRELVDIAGLLNNEDFIYVETFDARQAICDRLRSLSETIALTSGEPLLEDDDPIDPDEPLYFTLGETPGKKTNPPDEP